ncbi:MAG: phosphoribosylanthranilate isomerase [Candidatus Thioglobus sp.]|nr:phosphoribosylanthranilate isomerase [Candidatus Thioglobus sp.]
MKIKICGLTKAENSRQVAMLGADAIGLVFYAQSPRCVSAKTAVEIINALPPFVSRVGLFVNAEADFIDEILCEVPLDTLQFHGAEMPAECGQYGLPFIKAIPMKNTTNLAQIADEFHQSSALLLDTPSAEFGGSGQAFDLALITQIDKPIILAGGLNAENVAAAIKQANPYAVDVSSGVESSKGIKDIKKVKQFMLNCQ